ncbi:MAG: efflux RND transporter periplasmic adaptor subunit [Barnesiella sp.]
MKIRSSMIIQSQRIVVIALCLILFSCGKKNQNGFNSVKEYAVITVQPTHSQLESLYPATIRGKQDVEIRPQVSGFITKLCIDEGSVVKKGQPLFIIDQVQYEEAVNIADAAVNVAKSQVSTAQLTADNKKELAKRNIISQYELQMALNDLATAKANLAQANAQLVNARKNLSYTVVTSPSNGIAGNIPFRVGSLVSPSSATPLTTISDISEMFVYFSMNEKQILDLTRQGKGSAKEALDKMPEISLKLADGSVYPESGKIETISGVIDPATGAASIRATFPNPDRILRSGGTGSVLIPSTTDAAIIIPQKATYEIQDKRFVYLVNDSSIVHSTEITVSPVNDGKTYVVLDGLKAGDRIVIEGVGTSVKEGMTIKPITPEESAAKIKGLTQQASMKNTGK